MRLPKRRHQLLQTHAEQDLPYFLTPAALQRLKNDVEDLEKVQRPKAVADVAYSVKLGDLSENAEYKESRARLSSIDGRLFSIKERLRRVILIENDGGASGRVQLGSTVVLESNGTEKTYQIVGPHESNPTRGRISHISPLGAALMGHRVGEQVEIETPNGKMSHLIKEVR